MYTAPPGGGEVPNVKLKRPTHFLSGSTDGPNPITTGSSANNIADMNLPSEFPLALLFSKVQLTNDPKPSTSATAPPVCV